MLAAPRPPPPPEGWRPHLGEILDPPLLGAQSQGWGRKIRHRILSGTRGAHPTIAYVIYQVLTRKKSSGSATDNST